MDTLPDPAYAELYCLSNLSFQQATANVEDLLDRAKALGYAALAITEECSLYSAPRAHVHAQTIAFPLLIGCTLQLEEGLRLVLLVEDRAGYAALAQLISLARSRAEKGGYRIFLADLLPLSGLLAILLPEYRNAPAADHLVTELRAAWGGARLWLGLSLRYRGDQQRQLTALRHWQQHFQLPAVACTGVRMARRSERFLLDVLTAIRLRKPVSAVGWDLPSNGEQHLRTRQQLAQLYPAELLAESVHIAQRCRFSLQELRYHYPQGSCPASQSPQEYLQQEAEKGLLRRYPHGAPEAVRQQLQEELRIVAELGYANYFLTVYEIVSFARERDILCQGRGSAANSVLCYVLGITEVDPARAHLLFSRFLSRERGEPPDIDIDFEHERREEVIQYVFRRYGRRHAALTASIIHYRPRSAMRDAARALAFSASEQDQLCQQLAWWDGRRVLPERLQEAGFDPQHSAVQRLIIVVNALVGMPRHLSQHVGGMVLSETPLDALVPIEPARMSERTVLQWDKNDLDLLGILKVDLLALGMLTVLRRALADLHMRLADLPAEDPQVYAMLQRGESLGVFQVESRAQMGMLPRLKPHCFYDLVIEVAIIRPGPIQGGMVHPYLRRRAGQEAVSYPGPEVQKVLERTLGVPIFQEQVMQIAMEAAGFDGDAADGLRRAMAAWRRKGNLGPYQQRLLEGLAARGYAEDFAQQLCEQIRGFAEYGFPESHAASFALLVYASAWIKCHHPAVFTAALLNSQPMGFYAPAQIVEEAKRQGVQVLPVDIRRSHWETRARGRRVRLGLHQVKGLLRSDIERCLAWREADGNLDPETLLQDAGVGRQSLEKLARAGAFDALLGHRREALWQILALCKNTALALPVASKQPSTLPPPSAQSLCRDDYQQLGLSLGPHPLSFLRPQLEREGYRSIVQSLRRPSGTKVRVAGLVTHRQRPSTAHGTVFLTIVDESGSANLIVWPQRVEEWRRPVLHGKLLGVLGRLEKNGPYVHNIIVEEIQDYSTRLSDLRAVSQDFQ
ncbi:error-prone DNA polymerase [Acidithiobacillus sp. CV18-2]|uniref:Error-prone DNA polymerase n=1 Tax=Igneacidithiobacillus copahuensis TaxID=2724909 RepID=A0AAE2YS53_9PROT|nr:error-prone DNA polymerase [Igneacidithiobacillus copahuensis]MBU2755723.1 error-prone DNA polymerase [Acidithiobacillus sp. CV18-3]MBU2757066.1 error-prone DNA polymerase [Acidithiobacillus sp. BN09-2]MBU2778542.1 error-prone DNA polymerase [Acidithiobacillus sp. CV18-2]MBU2797686.1 error-prone DNA polymerase [Acidithiobacillus sp. VAN18-2]MBU2798156.1 error-prone DNA polymerase [Acidithiobacillus sp. VAN18-4]UTV82267.1 error-prone DNA polymerase [Acidithiobacillus sp. YTS05]